MSGISVQSIKVASLIEGAPSVSDFKLTDEKITLSLDRRSIGPDQCICVPEFISVDPYLRSRMAHWPLGYNGESITVLRVINSGNSVQMPIDTLIVGNFPWKTAHLLKISSLKDRASKGGESGEFFFQILSKSDSDSLLSSGLTSSALLGVLGLTGKTAYYGLLGVGDLKSTDNVFISGAAGATGSVCGELAKLKGCPTVVGTAGTDEKCRWLTSKLGFDTALNYKRWAKQDYRAIQADLKKAFPNGIDLYFDNTGGDVTTAVWDLLNRGARVVICGQIANYNLFKNQSDFASLDMPSTPDFLFKTIYNKIRVEGFLVGDCLEWGPYYRDMPQWIRQGKINNRQTIVNGFENVPRAFVDLLGGKNIGKMVVDCRGSIPLRSRL